MGCNASTGATMEGDKRKKAKFKKEGAVAGGRNSSNKKGGGGTKGKSHKKAMGWRSGPPDPAGLATTRVAGGGDEGFHSLHWPEDEMERETKQPDERPKKKKKNRDGLGAAGSDPSRPSIPRSSSPGSLACTAIPAPLDPFPGFLVDGDEEERLTVGEGRGDPQEEVSPSPPAYQPSASATGSGVGASNLQISFGGTGTGSVPAAAASRTSSKDRPTANSSTRSSSASLFLSIRTSGTNLAPTSTSSNRSRKGAAGSRNSSNNSSNRNDESEGGGPGAVVRRPHKHPGHKGGCGVSKVLRGLSSGRKLLSERKIKLMHRWIDDGDTGRTDEGPLLDPQDSVGQEKREQDVANAIQRHMTSSQNTQSVSSSPVLWSSSRTSGRKLAVSFSCDSSFQLTSTTGSSRGGGGDKILPAGRTGSTSFNNTLTSSSGQQQQQQGLPPPVVLPLVSPSQPVLTGGQVPPLLPLSTNRSSSLTHSTPSLHRSLLSAVSTAFADAEEDPHKRFPPVIPSSDGDGATTGVGASIVQFLAMEERTPSHNTENTISQEGATVGGSLGNPSALATTATTNSSKRSSGDFAVGEAVKNPLVA